MINAILIKETIAPLSEFSMDEFSYPICFLRVCYGGAPSSVAIKECLLLILVSKFQVLHSSSRHLLHTCDIGKVFTILLVILLLMSN